MQATAKTLYSKLPPQLALIIENAIYSSMAHLNKDYNGGSWNIRATQEGGKTVIKAVYLDGSIALTNHGAQVTDTVNGKVAGAVCVVTALNALCHSYYKTNQRQASQFFSELFYSARGAAIDTLSTEEASQFLTLTD